MSSLHDRLHCSFVLARRVIVAQLLTLLNLVQKCRNWNIFYSNFSATTMRQIMVVKTDLSKPVTIILISIASLTFGNLAILWPKMSFSEWLIIIVIALGVHVSSLLRLES